VEAALYDPELGFYASGGAAGRRGDFLTAPEVGPLFGALVARALDRWWADAGRPDPWLVVEAGAGRGTLARTVLAAAPACAGALRYVLVERSAALRAEHARHLPWSAPREVELDSAGGGPVVTSLGELPAGLDGPVAVLANELLDNLPFDVVERRDGRWCEVRVGAGAGGLEEVPVEAPPDVAARADALVPEATDGTRIPLQQAAAAWLAAALAVAPSVRVVVVDYTVPTTAELAGRGFAGWLRTYRGHERGGPPLADLGTQDLTCDVAEDQLARVRAPVARATQAEALAALGIDELVEEGRRVWAERAAVGDLAALRARSRAREAEALLDPAGLGAFTVLEWQT
jgi:SAM-dependent MidA family methyltransferase